MGANLSSQDLREDTLDDSAGSFFMRTLPLAELTNPSSRSGLDLLAPATHTRIMCSRTLALGQG